jgi:hypothetical protein
VGSFRGQELAPRVPTPWPQDHVIGQGRKSKLFYDDLNIYEWSQGVLSIMEAEENIDIIRYMLAHYRSVYRDAQNHGFEAAKWSNGVVLSMIEKGKLRWDQVYSMAEERRSALVAVSTPQKERSLSPSPQPARRAARRYNDYQGNRGNGGKGHGKKNTKVCQFYND